MLEELGVCIRMRVVNCNILSSRWAVEGLWRGLSRTNLMPDHDLAVVTHHQGMSPNDLCTSTPVELFKTVQQAKSPRSRQQTHSQHAAARRHSAFSHSSKHNQSQVWASALSTATSQQGHEYTGSSTTRSILQESRRRWWVTLGLGVANALY